MDRAYVDLLRLHRFHNAGAFFVTRIKRRILFRRRYSHIVDASTGVRSDHTVVLASAASHEHYPDALRRIHFYDAEKDRHLRFLTNNFDLPALTICLLYKSRWDLELFFKWVKQHLRIKAFYGYSENAVKTQIWIAVSVYVLVAILKKQLGWRLVFTKSYRYSASRFSSKCPFCRPSKTSTPKSNHPYFLTS